MRLRTRSSVYKWGSLESRDHRYVAPRCKKAEGDAETTLVVEYRDWDGSTVTVTLADGSVSVSPPLYPDRSGQDGASDVQIVDVLLNYD